MLVTAEPSSAGTQAEPGATASQTQTRIARPLAPKLRTRLTDLLGIESPVMLAGMGGVSGHELVAAVTNAGGFGTWGSANDVSNKDISFLREHMTTLREMCEGRPFGVDLLVHGSGGGMMSELVDVFSEGGAKAFISGRGHLNSKVIEVFHSRNVLVGAIGGKLEHCVSAVKAGVDFVICQGSEGGGHSGEIPLDVLLPQVVSAVGSKVPIVAAGGIHDGQGLASALARGADGVWLGTRFLMTHESNVHPVFRQKLIDAGPDDTCVTRAFSGYPMRALRTPYVEAYESLPKDQRPVGPKQLVKATKDGVWAHYNTAGLKDGDGFRTDFDVENQAYPTGRVCGLIKSIEPAGEVVRKITEDALAIAGRTSKL